NSKRYARDFVLLAGAVKNRENVSLIVPKAGDQGDPLAPSRLFFACSEKKTVERIQRFYDKSFSLSNNKNLFSQAGLQAGQTSKFLIPAPIENINVDTISVTSFHTFLACPYRFYLRHILK